MNPDSYADIWTYVNTLGKKVERTCISLDELKELEIEIMQIV